jgi:hypothetical protein
MNRKQVEFSLSQKAEIFCRDRATCSFTGANLWILDHGARWEWSEDWVDHEKPVKRGGTSIVNNGVCASWKANQRKSANGRDRQYWFYHGHPTWHYFYEQGAITKDLSERLMRLSRLQTSDWYFNRAIRQLLHALDSYRNPGQVRDEDYYLKSCLGFLVKWHKVRQSDSDKRSLEKREVLKRPLTHDMRLMLKLRDAINLTDVKRIANELGPIYRANVDTYYAFLTAATDRGRRSVLRKAVDSTRVSIRVIQSMRRLLADLDPKCGRLLV